MTKTKTKTTRTQMIPALTTNLSEASVTMRAMKPQLNRANAKIPTLRPRLESPLQNISPLRFVGLRAPKKNTETDYGNRFKVWSTD